jgi:uncharacterized protein YutE (UPF0331/DUF86 family)
MGIEEIKSKLIRLSNYLSRINALLILSNEDILKNEEKLLSVERLYQLVVDEAIDVNIAILSQKLNYIPESYRSSFLDMAEHKFLEKEFAEKISLSVKTRNQIVHDYEFVKKQILVADVRKYVDLYKEYFVLISEKF